MWHREEGYVPVGKVGLVCGKKVFHCKGGVIRDWRTVLQVAESVSRHATQLHLSHKQRKSRAGMLLAIVALARSPSWNLRSFGQNNKRKAAHCKS